MAAEDRPEESQGATVESSAAATKKTPRKKSASRKKAAKKAPRSSSRASGSPDEPPASVQAPAAGETAQAPPEVLPATPVVGQAETSTGISGVLALWGPLAIVGFLIAVLNTDDEGQVPAPQTAEILRAGDGIRASDLILELDEVAETVAPPLAAPEPTVMSAAGASSETDDAVSVAIPATGSAASDLAAAFAEAGVALAPPPLEETAVPPAASADLSAIGSTGVLALAPPLRRLGAAPNPALFAPAPAWPGVPTSQMPLYGSAAPARPASGPNPWAAGSDQSAWDAPEVAPPAAGGTDWPPPPPGVPPAPLPPPVASGYAGAAGYPGWPPQPVLVPCAPPYYWCLAPMMPPAGAPAYLPQPGY